MILGLFLATTLALLGHQFLRSYVRQMSLPIEARYSHYRGIGAASACCFVLALAVLSVTVVLVLSR